MLENFRANVLKPRQLRLFCGNKLSNKKFLKPFQGKKAGSDQCSSPRFEILAKT